MRMDYHGMILGSLLAMASSAAAAPVLTLSGPGTVSPGVPATLTIRLTGVSEADGMTTASVCLRHAPGGTPDAFTISSWNVSLSPFDALGASDSSEVVGKAIPSSGATVDLGGYFSGSQVLGSGDYTLAVLTLQPSSSLLPGSYSIQAVFPSAWTDRNLAEHSMSASYNFTVAVPEPASLGVLSLGGLLLLRRRGRLV